MRRLAIISILLLLTFYSGVAQAVKVWKQQVNTADTLLNGVSFIDQSKGWTVGENGVILRTIDRGVNWTPVASGTTQNLAAVKMASATSGWAVGNARTVVKYDGTAWTAATVTHPVNLDFTNVGLTGTGTVLVTTGLGFSSSDINFRNLFTSRDGGVTWTGTNIRNTGEATDILNSLYGVFFLDDSTGWVAGINDDVTPRGKVFKTTDGGATWSDVSPVGVDNIVFRALYFADRNRGWVAGGDSGSTTGYVYKTTDGGVTWSEAYHFTPAFFKSLAGISSTELWVSDRASLFNYADSLWAEFSVPLGSGYFTGVNFTDPWNGWAVGGQLTAEGGAKRYIYKMVVEPAALTADRTLYIASATYEVDVAFAGSNIQSNSLLSLEAASGITLLTAEARYLTAERKYRLDARVKIEPQTARTGFYTFTVTNPDEGTAATGTFSVQASASPGTKPLAQTLPAKTFDPAIDTSLTMQVATPGQVTSGGVRTSSVPPDVLLELIVFRAMDGQIAYRKKFNANPDGYTNITLSKITDLGIDISDGIYSSVVIHPQFGKIGSGNIIVQHSR